MKKKNHIHTVTKLITYLLALGMIVSVAIGPVQPAQAAAGYVGEIGSATANTAGTTLVIPVGGSGVTADNTIIVGFASRDGATYNAPVVTDDGGNTYNTATSAFNLNHGRTYIFYAHVDTALTSGNSITITTSSVESRVAVAAEFSGLLDVGVLDQTLSNPSGTTVQDNNPTVGPTGTTTQAHELLIGVIGTEEATDATVGTWLNGFSAGPQVKTSGATNEWRVSMGYQIVSTTGVYTAQKTVTNTPFWAATIATFRAANTAPVVSDIPNQTIAEGATFTTINLDSYVADSDNDDDEMTWTYSGETDLSVTIDSSRVATITIPTTDWFGSEIITFRATDPGLLYGEDPATFTVTNVNDTPVVTDIPDQTIPHGDDFATIDLDDYVSDVDNDDDQMTWTFSGNSELSVDITARVATISKPNPDWTGAETITFRATDPGFLYQEDGATFTVSDPTVYDVAVRVNQGSDDAEERVDNGAVDTTSGDLELIRDSSLGGFNQIVGVRFRNIQVPPLADIQSAYIEFEVDEETNINPCVLNIYGQAADNPGTFTSSTDNISNRDQTSASETWYPGNWTTENEKHQTDDISEIVQELVNRGGWTNGNAMAFTFEGSGQRVAKSYEYNTGDAPLLVITYTISAGPAINITDIPLSVFQNAPGVPSEVQSYTVSGENLTADIALNAPTNFEISTSSGSGFGSSLTLNESGGSISATPIYVRYVRATVGSSTGDISHSSAGATTRNLEVSGTTSDLFTEDFQEGFSGYSGTVDTFIRQTAADANTNFSTNIWLEWDDNHSSTDEISLLRFNNIFSSNGGPIPDGATIAAATLRYVVTAAEGGPADLYESLVDWPESTVTWNNFGGEPGVQVNEYDNFVTSAPANLPNTAFSIDVTDSLQRWSADPNDNLGWIFLPVNDTSSTLNSSDATTPINRPRLTVDYTTGSTLPTCYALTLGHIGNGSDPVPDPVRSTGCIVGEYLDGETVDLSAAVPDVGWQIDSWTNTDNDSSTASTNAATMPASALSVTVNYTDTTAPDTIITGNPPDPSNSVDASFTFTSTEVLSTYECQLDGAGFSTCTSPQDYIGLVDGIHNFDVRATDPSNNTDLTPASYSWEIDSTPPDTSITDNPADPSNSSDASFSFTSTEVGSTFECQMDGGGFSTCTSPQPYTGLTDSSHTFEVQATDTVTNTDPTPASYSWDIDTVAPDTNITDNPTDPSNSSDASFSFTSTEVGSTFECQIDGGGFSPCTSPQPYTGLADGAHTFDVQATDLAGNTDATPASFGWEIDATVPDTSITDNPTDPSNSADASFSFTSTEVGSTFECQIDGGGFSSCTSPQPYTGLADGLHTFEVRATDLVNNTDPTPASFSWEIDTVVPDTSLTDQPNDPSVSASASFSFTSTEVGSTFECQLDSGGYNPCTSPQAYTLLADGAHTFDVRATDPAGNTDQTPASYAWEIDTVVPDTGITDNPPDPSNSVNASFSFTSTKAGSTFECQLDGGGFSACTNPQAFAGLANGSHVFEVRATDPVGNTDPTPASYSWEIDTIAPNTSITLFPADISRDRDASFSFASNEVGSTFECQIDGGGFSPCTSPQVYTNLDYGSHTFDVRATDIAGNTDPTPDSDIWIVVNVFYLPMIGK